MSHKGNDQFNKSVYEAGVETVSDAGKKGGNITKGRGREFYSKIGKLGATKRWLGGEDFTCTKHGLDYRIMCEECNIKNKLFEKAFLASYLPPS